MEWTREKRYQRLEDIATEDYNQLLKRVEQSDYRQQYHVQPKTGLLNDPNGLSYFNGQYHLFYQWFPLGPVHGVKYWYHLVSSDLINWEDKGIGLSPDSDYDSHGVFSGSAFPTEEFLYLFYTGNTRTEKWERIPYQCIARMNKEGEVVKLPKPFISGSPKGYTDNFRDPKVIKQGERYICLIGGETIEHQGQIVYYQSDNLVDWEFGGPIQVAPYSNSGFMWECPDYFETEDSGVLLFSPQGMAPEGEKYQNIFQAGYLIGNKIDFDHPLFSHHGFVELDHGFDFYAPQTFLDPKGRRILIGWLGLPGVDCVTDDDGWAHCLTLPRVLEVKGDHLYQTPIAELKQLRQEEKPWHITLEDSMEVFKNEAPHLEWQIDAVLDTASLFGITFRSGEKEETRFYYDKDSNCLVLDKTKSGKTVTSEYGERRICPCQSEHLTIQLFLDESSVEIFVNDGQYVFSSRLYSEKDCHDLCVFAQGKAQVTSFIWTLS